jgi:thioredoxin reductase (NADPH)
MSVDTIRDVVIVGGGPGGLTAGLYCRRGALEAVLFEKAIPGGQVAISKDVENYPGVENITGFDLVERLLRQAKSYGLEVVIKEVAKIEPGEDFHTVQLADGETLRAYAVILAMGGSARKLNVAGETQYVGKGVSYCATCDGFFFRDKTVAVVGGGDTAIEEALYLSRLVKKVYLIHRRDTLRASRLLQERIGADPKIEPIWNTVVREIKGDEKEVQSLVLEDVVTGRQSDLCVDGIFIFVGYSPANQLVPREIRMNDLGYVLTDEKCETSVSGIFAIGDLRQKYANQIVIAASDGCIAALAATHLVEEKKYKTTAR